nr:reverse transcriptase domain-containing protein [Tanacetum cinerariifolium]
MLATTWHHPVLLRCKITVKIGFQNQPLQAPNNQGLPKEFSSFKKSNETMMRNSQIQINELKGNFNKQEENLGKNLNDDMRSILGSFFQNQGLTLGTLSSNTIPNPKGEIKAITTRSGVAYEGPSIPTNLSPKKVVKQETEETMDKSKQISKEVPLTSNLRFADALLLMPKFASTCKSLFANKDKLFELAKIPLNENFSAMLLKKLSEKLEDPGKFLIPCDFPGMDVCHALADLGASINPMPLCSLIVLTISYLLPP